MQLYASLCLSKQPLVSLLAIGCPALVMAQGGPILENSIVRHSLGTSTEDIIAIDGEPESKIGQRVLSYETSLNGLECTLLYAFQDEGLVSMTYSIPMDSDSSTLFDQYEAMTDFLTALFGEKRSENYVWVDETYLADPTSYGKAVADGHLQVETYWWGEEYSLIQRMNLTKDSVRNVIQYGGPTVFLDEEKAAEIEESAQAAEMEGDAEAVALLATLPPIPLKIEKARVKDSRGGTPEVYVDVKNITKDIKVEAFDFQAECFDKYGDLVRGNGGNRLYKGTYQDRSIKPGKKSDSSWRWTMYGFDNAYTVKVALTRILSSDGTIWEIPPSQRVWVEGSK